MQQSFNEILDQVKKLDVNQIQEVYWVTREILFEKQQKERFEKAILCADLTCKRDKK